MYDEDYFEHGEKNGVSLYTDYRWLPELTIPMAARMLEYLSIRDTDTVLDFGCAKGFLVYAMRLLGREAYGYDISKYAWAHAHPPVAARIHNDLDLTFDHPCDWVVCKDVLEHVEKADLVPLLSQLRSTISRGFFVVPLGDGKRYCIPDYEKDATHVIREPMEWWAEQFAAAGYTSLVFSYDVPGIKDKWVQVHPEGNGFFTVGR